MDTRAAAAHRQKKGCKMITPPRTYTEWMAVIDVFRERSNDQDAIQAMKNGRLEWQSGVAERFSKRFIDAINYRMNFASDRFQRDMRHSAGQERGIVQALISLRRELMLLADAVDLPAIPEEIRAQYRSLVLQQADVIQKSLEDSAKKDRSGKLASLVRNNRVNAFAASPSERNI